MLALLANVAFAGIGAALLGVVVGFLIGLLEDRCAIDQDKDAEVVRDLAVEQAA